MSERGDFYEDDEPIEDVVEALESGEPTVTRRPKSEVRRTNAPVSVRLTPEQAAQLHEAADAKRMSISQFLRWGAFEKIAETLDGVDPQRPPAGWVCQHLTITGSHLLGRPAVGCGCTMSQLHQNQAA